MRTEEIPELSGNRAGNHEVMNRHQLIHSGIEPVDSLLTLTSWAMAVSAGSEDLIGIRAVFTGAYDRSQLRCSTLDDCLYHFFVIGRHPPAKGVQIRLPMGKEQNSGPHAGNHKTRRNHACRDDSVRCRRGAISR